MTAAADSLARSCRQLSRFAIDVFRRPAQYCARAKKPLSDEYIALAREIALRRLEQGIIPRDGALGLRNCRHDLSM
jgi:hypothetical protein